jgi:hypothetical protein
MIEYSADQERVPAGSTEGGEFAGDHQPAKAGRMGSVSAELEKENTTMRCKVACSMKQPYEDGCYLSFYPVYAVIEENKEFFKDTRRWYAGGTVTFNVMNKAAAERFEVGKEYYLDFSPA